MAAKVAASGGAVHAFSDNSALSAALGRAVATAAASAADKFTVALSGGSLPKLLAAGLVGPDAGPEAGMPTLPGRSVLTFGHSAALSASLSRRTLTDTAPQLESTGPSGISSLWMSDTSDWTTPTLITELAKNCSLTRFVTRGPQCVTVCQKVRTTHA